MCGIWTPIAPRSIAMRMSAALLLCGRTIGVMPEASAAITICSIVSRPMVPCSQSMSTQSKPMPAAISTICADGIITESPKAGCPEVKRIFIWLVCMAASSGSGNGFGETGVERGDDFGGALRRRGETLLQADAPGPLEKCDRRRGHGRIDPHLAQQGVHLHHLVVAARVRGAVGAHPVAADLFERSGIERGDDLPPQVLLHAGATAGEQAFDQQGLEALGED